MLFIYFLGWGGLFGFFFGFFLVFFFFHLKITLIEISDLE